MVGRRAHARAWVYHRLSLTAQLIKKKKRKNLHWVVGYIAFNNLTKSPIVLQEESLFSKRLASEMKMFCG